MADAAPRGETNAELKELRGLIESNKNDIQTVRRERSHSAGGDEATKEARATAAQVRALLISTALAILGLLGTWAFMIYNVLTGD